ncbi:MAG: hypothetical protein RTU30_01075 [Candidatus Thorarchaeota archaeon]
MGEKRGTVDRRGAAGVETIGVLPSQLLVSDITMAVVCAIVGGFWGGLLPDLVEPPRHYNLRGFFHSIRLGRYLPLVMLLSLMGNFLEPRF